MNTKDKKQCTRCKNWIPKDAEKCNFCGYDKKELESEQKRNSIIRIILSIIIALSLIFIGLYLYLENFSNFEQQNLNDLWQYLPFLMGIIFIIIFVGVLINNISKIKQQKSAPANVSVSEQLQIRSAVMKCKRCKHQGKSKEFYKNWFLPECPSCKTNDQLYAVIKNGQEIKVNKYGRIILIIVIILGILFALLD